MGSKKHADISPSGFGRIGYCPASVLLSKYMPDDASEFAAEGTRAHRLAELALLLRARTPEEDAEWLELLQDKEMAQEVGKYLSVIRALKPETADLYRVEVRLPLETITTERDAFGTADCVVIKDGTLHVFDLKYGKGIQVDAHNNPQLIIYALAALAEFDPEGMWYGVEMVELHICQPRMENFSNATINREELERKALPVVRKSAERALYLVEHPDELRIGAPFLAEEPQGDFAEPSEDICRFCKAKSKCPMLAKQVAEVVDADFEVLEKAEPAELVVPQTAERLAFAWRFLPAIRMWCDAVEGSMYARMQSGESFPGYKLVAGRAGPRKWADAKAAEEIVRKALPVSQAYDRKVISPTSAEKFHKSGDIGPKHWAQLQALITRSDGKPVIVVDDDPRPAITAQIEKDFEALE